MTLQNVQVSIETQDMRFERWRKQLADIEAQMDQNNYLPALLLCDVLIFEQPSHINALNMAAFSAEKLGFKDLALQYLLRITKDYPSRPQVRLNLARLYSRLNKTHEEFEVLEKALADQVLNLDLKRRLAQVFYAQNRHQESFKMYKEVYDEGATDVFSILLLFAGDHLMWDYRAQLNIGVEEYLQTDNEDLIICPFDVITNPLSHLQLKDLAGRWSRQRYKDALAMPQLELTYDRHPPKIKIGYLTADLGNHATMYLLKDVFAKHDMAHFEIYFYNTRKYVEPRWIDLIKECGVQYVNLADMEDLPAAKQIQTDGIHILVEMKGFTAGERLSISSLRPAPIIASWLGYPGTLGIERLADYIIGDAVVTPIELQDGYSEAIAQVEHCYQPNSFRQFGPEQTRAQNHLPDNKLVFVSMNNTNKMTPLVMDTWCEIMKKVPNSVLWLFCSSPERQEIISNEATKRGISADRVIYANAQDQNDHLSRLRLADIALDPFPCNSHTTGSDILWAAVPMVSLIGTTFAGRVGATLLHHVGLDELIVQDISAYTKLIVDLAKDKKRLNKLKQFLIDARETAPLFQIDLFTKDMEKLYADMWQQHLEGVRQPILASRPYPSKK